MNLRSTLTSGIGFLLLLAATGISLGSPVSEVEPNNDSATAQNVDGLFTLEFSEDIGDQKANTSQSIPHVSVLATGDGTFDFFSFTTRVPFSRVIFDVDHASVAEGVLDTELFTFLPDGRPPGRGDEADDAFIGFGAGGSVNVADPYLEATFPEPGLYVVGVGRFNSFRSGEGGLSGVPLARGDRYTLQISIAVPEPAMRVLASQACVCLLVPPAFGRAWKRRDR